MKKLFLALLISIVIVSCSNNDNEKDYYKCIENNTVKNGFIYECNTYNTGTGRMNMSYTTEFATTSCMLEFVNSEYSDFSFEDGDSNVNIVRIWISVPSENYKLKEIPEGTYELRNYNDDPSSLDIVTLFIVGPNSSVYKSFNSLYFNGSVLGQAEIYKRAVLTIIKLSNDEYEINYLFEADGKIVKGHYRGFLSFIDTWA